MEHAPARRADRASIGYGLPLWVAVIASAGTIYPWTLQNEHLGNVLLASGGAMALGIVCLAISLSVYAINIREQHALEAELAATERDLERVSAQAETLLRQIGSPEPSSYRDV